MMFLITFLNSGGIQLTESADRQPNCCEIGQQLSCAVVPLGILQLPLPTDFDLKRYATRLYERRDEGTITRFARASIGDWTPSQRNCHENVTMWCTRNPAHRSVRGWLFFDFDWNLDFVRFTAHSVIRNENGELVDITPSLASQPYPFIVATEPELEYAGLVEDHGVTKIDYFYRTGSSNPSELTGRSIGDTVARG